MIVRPRDRFSTEVTLDPSLVTEFARAAGDPNPVHHDAAFAATTRFGRPIASGTHTTALLLGLTASHFSRGASMVGLEFCVQFRRPVFADETIRLEWLVIKVTANARLGGDVVELRGRIKSQDGQTAVGAKDSHNGNGGRGRQPLSAKLTCPDARLFFAKGWHKCLKR